MKGVRFYEEFSNKRKGTSEGNVVAVDLETGRLEPYTVLEPVGNEAGIQATHYRYVFDGVGAVHFYPNSPVASTGVSREWLDKQCKRVSERRAREVHPNLFTYLDQ